MSSAGYTRPQIAFLLSLSHEEAIEATFPVGSSLRKLSDETDYHGFCAEDSDVPLIARWTEVDQARKRVSRNKEHIALAQMRLQGYSDEEVAARLGLSRRTVGRRWRATLQEVLELLGGESEGTVFALDHIDLCLRCGEQPRSRTTRRTRRWTSNGWRWKTIEAPSSMCSECLAGVTGNVASAA